MKNSEKTHCKHGHEYTPENTLWSARKNGAARRQCRKCLRDRATKWESANPETAKAMYRKSGAKCARKRYHNELEYRERQKKKARERYVPKGTPRGRPRKVVVVEEQTP